MQNPVILTYIKKVSQSVFCYGYNQSISDLQGSIITGGHEGWSLTVCQQVTANLIKKICTKNEMKLLLPDVKA